MFEVLEYVDPQDLRNKIRNFWSLNIRRLSTDEIRQHLYDVLYVTLPDSRRMTMLFPDAVEIKSGSALYRVRKVSEQHRENPFGCIQDIKDVWCPPAEKCKLGRINGAGEAVLYTSLSLQTAIEECRCKSGDLVSVIRYTATSKVSCVDMARPRSPFAFTKEYIGPRTNKQKEVLNILHDFLRVELTRDVGEGTEYLYKVSQLIASEFFKYPSAGLADAWLYPSIVNKPDYNVCFTKDACEKKLKFEAALVAQYEVTNDIVQYGQARFVGFDPAGIPFLYPRKPSVADLFSDLKKN